MAILLGKPRFESLDDMHIWMEENKGKVLLKSCKNGQTEIVDELTIWSDGKLVVAEKGNLFQ